MTQDSAGQLKPNVWLSIAFGLYFVVVVIGVGHIVDLCRSLSKRREPWPRSE